MMQRFGDEIAHALVESSPDGLLLVDDAGEIHVANEAACAMFGHPVSTLVGMSVDELVPSEFRADHAGRRRSYAKHPTKRPMGTDLELLGQHAEGNTFPVEISLSPVDLGGETYTIAAVRDVTDRQETMARVALLRDRERIARDIHDMVIQRIFAAGMSLQALNSLIDSPAALDRVATVTEELDDTIRQLRAAIFRLGQPEHDVTLSGHIASIVDERSRHLGFVPTMAIAGRIDDLPAFIADELVATLTEALSNVARHAKATMSNVLVRRSADRVTLIVSDNGSGIVGDPKTRGGLSNMMWRAAELGGTCSVEGNDPTGTVVTWSVPTGSRASASLSAD